MAKLSQYEIEREANIARNKALLEQLELKQAVDNLQLEKKPVPKPKAKPVQPVKKEKKQDAETRTTRRSTRLKATVDPTLNPAAKRKREEEIEVERAIAAEARIEEEERERQAKRPRHGDLDLSLLVGLDEPEDASTLAKELSGIPVHPAHKGIIPQDDETTDAKAEERATKALEDEFKNVGVLSRAKVTTNRVYCAAYHPDENKDLIFFGDKAGMLGIWDATASAEDDTERSETSEDGKYWRLQLHWPATTKSTISSIQFNPTDYHKVFTTSYDCTVRNLDFTTGVSNELYSSEDILLTSMDLTPEGHGVWIADNAGGITHLDIRESKESARWYQVAEQKIGSISVNPQRPEFVVTASNDRTLKIWDVRNFGKMKSGDTKEFDSGIVQAFTESNTGAGTFRGEWRHGKSASSAYWDPRGRRIVSTSYDDILRVWDFKSSVFESKKEFPSLRPECQVKHNCQTGRWLTILRARWSPSVDAHPHFIIGNMDHSLDVRTDKGALVAKLQNKNKISAVQSVVTSHSRRIQRLATGNASGRCVLWGPKDEVEDEEAEE
ncbi:WD40 repeat-like protein [Cylindrobasidium torrendii FP15055 ss-10]|uniref:DNA damage-binding protein CMR1 n=1 Tax=Cylindrobasidium torrendii FP15055 ss-10 TaxID=1314674 RepID=A0A0D7BNS3_9AGAR|nr:WD40 repeat-like protein [Cylindrobasidium torrendii FP15055 ss-10]